MKMSADDLLCYYEYEAVIRTECPVWHSNLIKGLSEQLETIQRRDLYKNIIKLNYHLDIQSACPILNLEASKQGYK